MTPFLKYLITTLIFFILNLCITYNQGGGDIAFLTLMFLLNIPICLYIILKRKIDFRGKGHRFAGLLIGDLVSVLLFSIVYYYKTGGFLFS